MKASVYIGAIYDVKSPDSGRWAFDPDLDDLLSGGEFESRVIDINFGIFQIKGKFPVGEWSIVSRLDRLAERRSKADVIELERLCPEFQRDSFGGIADQKLQLGRFGSTVQLAVVMMGHSGLISGAGYDVGSAEQQSRGEDLFKRCISGVAALITSE